MDDQAKGQDAIKDRVRTRASRSRGTNHGNETWAEQALESPVVRGMGTGWFRKLGGVVDRTLVDGFHRSVPHIPGSNVEKVGGNRPVEIRSRASGRNYVNAEEKVVTDGKY